MIKAAGWLMVEAPVVEPDTKPEIAPDVEDEPDTKDVPMPQVAPQPYVPWDPDPEILTPRRYCPGQKTRIVRRL